MLEDGLHLQAARKQEVTAVLDLVDRIISVSGTIVAAFFGVAGAALGAFINQRGARRVAASALEGQRALARDAAKRDARREVTRSILTRLDERALLFGELSIAALQGRDDTVAEVLDRIDQMQPESLAHLAITDPAFVRASEECGQCEAAIREAIRQESPVSRGSRDDRRRIVNAVDAYRNSVIALHGAVEDFWLELD